MLKYLLLGLAVLFALVGGLVLALGLSLVFALVAAVIPWLVYTYTLVPFFHWPAVGYLPMVGIVWAISFIARLLTSPVSVKVKGDLE